MTHPPQQPLDELQVRPRYHIEGQPSTVGERWLIWDNVEGHFARFRNIADAGDAYNLCKTLNDAHQEIQRLREALEAVESEIMLDGQLAEIVQAALSSQENKDDR